MEFVIIGVLVVQAVLMALWVRACTRQVTEQILPTTQSLQADIKTIDGDVVELVDNTRAALKRLPKSRSKKSAQPTTVTVL